MKKIAVFTNMPHNEYGAPVFKPIYQASYTELSKEIAKLGGQLYITRDQESYLGNGSFSRSWIMTDAGLTEAGPVTVDAIFNKGRFESDNTIPILNPPKLKKVCDNKWLMYQMFSEYCPQTFFIENPDELLAAFTNITTKKVVFKPHTGSEGMGVIIEEKGYLVQHLSSLLFPGIVSEFLDTSHGIPGITEGTHDLRLAFLDEEIAFSYVRKPPAGSLLANISQGGSFTMLDPRTLPPEVISIAQKIDSHFADCGHRFYCIDFGYTLEGPKIIEMNSEVRLSPNSDSPIFATFKKQLAQVLMDL